ncbi:MAG: EVE domain-containing protein [Phormidium sp.]
MANLSNYWLMQSEAEVYSIADLERDRQTISDGVLTIKRETFLVKQGNRLSVIPISETGAKSIFNLSVLK